MDEKATNSNYLEALGVVPWVRRDIPEIKPPTVEKSSSDSFNLLKQQVLTCTKCDLHKTRTQAVFGCGSENAKLMIIGEAPGFYEDQKGEPFVGRAGSLLTNMLKGINIDRKDVYITNVIKCRPQNNRDPLPTEINSCTPYLERQVQFLKPKLILALGRHAAHYLLETNESLARLRDKVHRFRDTKIPLIVTYHPAYLLRNPVDKAKAYKDLLNVDQILTDN